MSRCGSTFSNPYLLHAFPAYTALQLRGFDLGGNQVGVDPCALRSEVNSVVPEQVRPANARGVPVDEHGIWVPSHPVGQHRVVRLFPEAWNLYVYKHDLAHAREHPHHLVELLTREGAVRTEVDDHDLAELVGSAALSQDIDCG